MNKYKVSTISEEETHDKGFTMQCKEWKGEGSENESVEEKGNTQMKVVWDKERHVFFMKILMVLYKSLSFLSFNDNSLYNCHYFLSIPLLTIILYIIIVIYTFNDNYLDNW